MTDNNFAHRIFPLIKHELQKESVNFVMFAKILALVMSCTVLAEAITINRDTLANGIVVLTVEAHKIPLIQARVMVGAGSVYDPPGKEGLANLTSELLVRGTKKLTTDDIFNTIESVGGELSAFADEDYAGLSGKTLSKDLNILIDLMSDCLLNPRFDSVEVSRVKKEVISEIMTNADDPYQISEVGFLKLLFNEHPLNHLPIGFDSAAVKLGVSDVRAFYETYYKPENTFFVFVGDFNRASVLEMLGSKFGSGRGKKKDTAIIKKASFFDKPVGKIIKRDISQAYILLGFPAPGYFSEDWIPTRVMNSILGGSTLTSRIGKKIRDEKGLAYTAYSAFYRYNYGGYYMAEVQTKNETASEAVQALIQEITMMPKGADKKELDDAKSFYIGHFPLTFDTYWEMAALAAQIEIEKLGLDYPARFPELISAVTMADVIEAARNNLHPDRFYLVIVGNIKPEDIKVEGIEWVK